MNKLVLLINSIIEQKCNIKHYGNKSLKNNMSTMYKPFGYAANMMANILCNVNKYKNN